MTNLEVGIKAMPKDANVDRLRVGCWEDPQRMSVDEVLVVGSVPKAVSPFEKNLVKMVSMPADSPQARQQVPARDSVEGDQRVGGPKSVGGGA